MTNEALSSASWGIRSAPGAVLIVTPGCSATLHGRACVRGAVATWHGSHGSTTTNFKQWAARCTVQVEEGAIMLPLQSQGLLFITTDDTIGFCKRNDD